MRQDTTDRSIGDLLRDLSAGTAQLIRQEIRLARTETTESLHKLGGDNQRFVGRHKLQFAPDFQARRRLEQRLPYVTLFFAQQNRFDLATAVFLAAMQARAQHARIVKN